MCGIVQPAQFPELAQMQHWLRQGYAGEMQYLQDPRRQDPTSAMNGIRSIIVCALNYNSDYPLSTAARLRENVQQTENGSRGWISRYAWGRDYHEVVWEKLNDLQGCRSRVASMAPKKNQEPFSSLSKSVFFPSQPRPAYFARTRSATGPVHRRCSSSPRRSLR